MNSVNALSAQQLRQAADIKEKIDALQNRLGQLLGGGVPKSPPATKAPRKKHRMSPAGRKAIAEAAKARWAKYNAGKAKPAKKAKRTLSPAAKAKMAALMKARWAKAKKLGKAKL
jgi:hypothetical protein